MSAKTINMNLSLSIPSSTAQLCGKFLPFVQAFPSNSIKASIASCPGDLFLLVLLGMIARAEFTRRVTPAKWRDIWTSVDVTLHHGTSFWIISILDVLVQSILRKLYFSGERSVVVFGLGWFLPSRFVVFRNLWPNLSNIDQTLNASTRNLIIRMTTVGIIVGGIFLVDQFLELNISTAMEILLPLIAAMVGKW
jgi:hypothetical protein